MAFRNSMNSIRITRTNTSVLWDYSSFLQRLPEWEYILTANPFVRNRSIEQNCLYWSWITIVASETWNSKDAIHALMKKRFLSKRKLVKIGWKRNYVNIEGSTKELSVKRFTKYLDDIYVFFAERDLTLPTMEQSDIDSLIATYWHM